MRALPATTSGPVRDIEDRYLDGTSLRLRHVRVGEESVYKLTQKVRVHGPAAVSVTNMYLMAEEHSRLSALPAAVLTKTRSVCPVASQLFVVDEFSGHLTGLRLAEVEVQHLDETVALPDWLGPEVSHDERFSGGALAVADAGRVADLLALS